MLAAEGGGAPVPAMLEIHRQWRYVCCLAHFRAAYRGD